MEILSRIQPFIADSDDGPDTVLYLKGFSGREEIEFFMERLITVSFMKESDNISKLNKENPNE